MKTNLILIIEDDNEGRFNLEDEFRNLDYPVLSVGNGKQGLSILETFPVLPDFILLDKEMPILDGVQFINQMKQNLRFTSIPVILMSHHSQDRMYAEDRNLGFIQKPFTFKALLELITKIR